MPESRISDETLMAYADRELSDAEALSVEQAVARDPRLASRLQLFIRTRSDAKGAYQEIVEEPVPPQLLARVQAMIAAHQRPAARVGHEPGGSGLRVPRGGRWAHFAESGLALPLAASIAALAIGAAGYLAGQLATPSGAGRGTIVLSIGSVETEALSSALSTLPGGAESMLARDESGPVVRIVASFRDARGSLCREFELRVAGGPTAVAVACRDDRAWKVGFAMTAAPIREGYPPASASEPLDAYLESIGAGESLTPPEEQAALRNPN